MFKLVEFMQSFQANRYRYTEFFCEENIWWLARSLIDEGFDERQIKVLFFSNAGKSILLSNQRAAAPQQLVIWDYHVVLELSLEQQPWIFDFDSRLGFPEQRDVYLSETFPAQHELAGPFRSQVRIVPAGDFLRFFSSDRSHMQGRLAASAFPDYPIIQPEPGERSIDIADYWDMNKALEGCEIKSVASLSGQT